jgi:predicted nucleic acid-binding protein
VIVLDTNVLSELIKAAPAPQVLRWVDDQNSAELVITSITAAELRAGVAVLSRGRRKETIARQIERLINDVFGGYVLPFDASSSSHYADIVATSRRRGRPMSALDVQIAAICLQHEAALATRNVDDFSTAMLTLVDPWFEPGGDGL